MKRVSSPESTTRTAVLPALGAGFSLALLLSACGPAEHHADSSTKHQAITSLTPDMSGFLKQGTSDTCFNGGARPCAVLLRTHPKLDAEYVNTDPSAPYVAWPLERYAGHGGDRVAVLCYTATGQKITPFEGDSSSKDWYKVAVPMQHVQNTPVREEAKQHINGVDTIHYAGAQAVIGWASVEWFGQDHPVSSIPEC